MAKFYDYLKLGLENWKAILSILTLLLGLIGSGVGNYVQSQETESYKQGYKALAHNVSVATKNVSPKVSSNTISKVCDCSQLETRIQQLERFH